MDGHIRHDGACFRVLYLPCHAPKVPWKLSVRNQDVGALSRDSVSPPGTAGLRHGRPWGACGMGKSHGGVRFSHTLVYGRLGWPCNRLCPVKRLYWSELRIIWLISS